MSCDSKKLRTNVDAQRGVRNEKPLSNQARESDSGLGKKWANIEEVRGNARPAC
jgi:hypothetical protein